ncbi:MAG TPA: hypothetical protein VGM92_11595 [Candidatus Kapabacteria bacterium]
MENAIIIRGRQVGPNQIETDEKFSAQGQDLAVIVLPLPVENGKERETIFDFLKRLPAGNRSRQEIDQQIKEDRNW